MLLLRLLLVSRSRESSPYSTFMLPSSQLHSGRSKRATLKTSWKAVYALSMFMQILEF